MQYFLYFLKIASQAGREIVSGEVAGSIPTVAPLKRKKRAYLMFKNLQKLTHLKLGTRVRPTFMGSENRKRNNIPFIVLKPASSAVGSDESLLFAT